MMPSSPRTANSTIREEGGRRSPFSTFRRQPTGRKVAPYLFILPSVLIFLLFIVWPAFQGFYQSLFTRGIIVNSTIPQLRAHFVGLSNFVTLFGDLRFLHALGRTFLYTVIAVPATMVVSLAIALLLQPKFPGVGVVRSIVYWPSMISLIIVGISWRWILGYDTGIFNYLLQSLGYSKIPWLINPSMAMVTVIVVSVWATSGFYMVIYLAGLNAIPDVYYEAATIDGASRTQRFRLITLPLLRPTTLLVLVLTSINSFKVFQQVVVLTNGGPARATVFMVQNIYQDAFTRPNMVGYASAESVVFFLIMLVLTLVQMRLNREGDAA